MEPAVQSADDFLVIPSNGTVEEAVDRLVLTTLTEQLTTKRSLRGLLRTKKKSARRSIVAENCPTAEEIFLKIFGQLSRLSKAKHPELLITHDDKGDLIILEGLQSRVYERIQRRLLQLKYPDPNS